MKRLAGAALIFAPCFAVAMLVVWLCVDLWGVEREVVASTATAALVGMALGAWYSGEQALAWIFSRVGRRLSR